MTTAVATRSERRVENARMGINLVAEDFTLTRSQRIANLSQLSDLIHDLIDKAEDSEDQLWNHIEGSAYEVEDLRAALDEDEEELDEEIEEEEDDDDVIEEDDTEDDDLDDDDLDDGDLDDLDDDED